MIRPITMSKDKKISKDSLLKGRGQQLYKHAKELIPGGTQLLSKRPEMFAQSMAVILFESKRIKSLGLR